MRILFLGDIVGRPGREIISELLPDLREKENIDFVIANGENAAGGSGLTPKITEDLLGSGIDVLTSGDHIWNKREIYEFLNKTERLIRPANYPEGAPGKGFTVLDVGSRGKICVINIIGRVFMDAVDCPFKMVRKVVEQVKETAKVIVVDIHAEATSEKVAMGWYLDGLVSIVAGTHTHIQTADEKILPKGTAYITDCGMTGPYDSVIGRKQESILARFLTQMPTRFEMAENDVEMHGIIAEISDLTGKAESIKRVQERLP